MTCNLFSPIIPDNCYSSSVALLPSLSLKLRENKLSQCHRAGKRPFLPVFGAPGLSDASDRIIARLSLETTAHPSAPFPFSPRNKFARRRLLTAKLSTECPRAARLIGILIHELTRQPRRIDFVLYVFVPCKPKTAAHKMGQVRRLREEG